MIAKLVLKKMMSRIGIFWGVARFKLHPAGWKEEPVTYDEGLGFMRVLAFFGPLFYFSLSFDIVQWPRPQI